jgi:ceramide glucosyltransferase
MLQTLLTIFQNFLFWFLLLLSAGGLAYFLLAIYCANRLRHRRAENDADPASQSTPISLLKPLCGAEPELESCLASFFSQQFPNYEILFAVRHSHDPAVSVVDRLRQRFPRVPATMIYTGEPPWPNAKVYSLEKMAAAARYELLVMTDSDTSVADDYLQAVAKEFADARVGAVTNLYRGVSGDELWARLEALGMSTEFMAGVVVAERLEGMKFTLGPSMAIRASCLKEIGGFAAMKDYLADDFVLGHWADAAGWRVKLSTHVINHHVSSTGFLNTFRHRLRWNRSTRFSRGTGYIGQGFTCGLSWTLLLLLTFPSLLTLTFFLLILLVRCVLAAVIGTGLLSDKTVLRQLWLLPIQDLISFVTWIGGFSGREILWRNERYRLLKGGRFAPVTARANEGTGV